MTFRHLIWGSSKIKSKSRKKSISTCTCFSLSSTLIEHQGALQPSLPQPSLVHPWYVLVFFFSSGSVVVKGNMQGLSRPSRGESSRSDVVLHFEDAFCDLVDLFFLDDLMVMNGHTSGVCKSLLSTNSIELPLFWLLSFGVRGRSGSNWNTFSKGTSMSKLLFVRLSILKWKKILNYISF